MICPDHQTFSHLFETSDYRSILICDKGLGLPFHLIAKCRKKYFIGSFFGRSHDRQCINNSFIGWIHSCEKPQQIITTFKLFNRLVFFRLFILLYIVMYTARNTEFNKILKRINLNFRLLSWLLRLRRLKYLFLNDFPFFIL